MPKIINLKVESPLIKQDLVKTTEYISVKVVKKVESSSSTDSEEDLDSETEDQLPRAPQKPFTNHIMKEAYSPEKTSAP